MLTSQNMSTYEESLLASACLKKLFYEHKFVYHDKSMLHHLTSFEFIRTPVHRLIVSIYNRYNLQFGIKPPIFLFVPKLEIQPSVRIYPPGYTAKTLKPQILVKHQTMSDGKHMGRISQDGLFLSSMSSRRGPSNILLRCF